MLIMFEAMLSHGTTEGVSVSGICPSPLPLPLPSFHRVYPMAAELPAVLTVSAHDLAKELHAQKVHLQYLIPRSSPLHIWL